MLLYRHSYTDRRPVKSTTPRCKTKTTLKLKIINQIVSQVFRFSFISFISEIITSEGRLLEKFRKIAKNPIIVQFSLTKHCEIRCQHSVYETSFDPDAIVVNKTLLKHNCFIPNSHFFFSGIL